MDCRSLLQRIFPTQGSNPDLLHCRQTLCHLSHREVLACSILLCYIQELSGLEDAHRHWGGGSISPSSSRNTLTDTHPEGMFALGTQTPSNLTHKITIMLVECKLWVIIVLIFQVMSFETKWSKLLVEARTKETHLLQQEALKFARLFFIGYRRKESQGPLPTSSSRGRERSRQISRQQCSVFSKSFYILGSFAIATI